MGKQLGYGGRKRETGMNERMDDVGACASLTLRVTV